VLTDTNEQRSFVLMISGSACTTAFLVMVGRADARTGRTRRWTPCEPGQPERKRSAAEPTPSIHREMALTEYLQGGHSACSEYADALPYCRRKGTGRRPGGPP